MYSFCGALKASAGANAINFNNGVFETPQADPSNVASIILGGGAGTRLFPLTSRRAKPADAKNKNVEHVLILSGDHLYRMNYMEFVQKHIDTNADITVSCVPMDDRYLKYLYVILHGLVAVSGNYRILIVLPFNLPSFRTLKVDKSAIGEIFLPLQQVDTTLLGLSKQEAMQFPYIASMGVYVFRTDVMLKLLRCSYPSCNDFGSEIIPSAVKEHNVQAYLFNDYWEDIGTIKSLFDANLALTEQSPKFEFYDPKTPFFTSPRFLPPTKVDKCRIVDAIISHGCFLRECSLQHSIVGVRSRLESGVELIDTMMMGADYYQTESEIASLLAEGKVPIGVGQNTKIRNCIIDKNAKIGKDVIITNADGVQEADRPGEGFYIRSGIVAVLKNATIKDGTII
ncbi:GLUCOSE-1-PHOSPHATE ADENYLYLTRANSFERASE LARGE SUBUNIT 3 CHLOROPLASTIC [Salix koriyanagi]|uniref:glucose-1-phosphate adenylyltransferase n=1 Tax=Salix koriyanagi TaxID=2511006 RepID=A0A9Q0QLD9_9ROSI|nr:GLUCOSE-1-PHOSPHATE ADENYLYLTRANSFERASE LARGE SUBUNIT 3 CHLOROPLASTIC [Salix koriyanagi]